MPLLLALRLLLRLIEQMAEADRVIRAMTDDGAFRIIAVRTSNTVTEASTAQSVSTNSNKVIFGELLTSAVLYRETMAPSLRVQCIVQNRDGAPQLLADSHPDGWVRGLFQPEARTGGKALNDHLLQMMRTLPNGELHRGIVEVGQEGNLSTAFERYMQRSEQITSMVSLGVSVVGEYVASGGLLVQLLPEAAEAEGALKKMTARLAAFQDITDRVLSFDGSPTALVDDLLEGMKHTQLHESEVRFSCNCSQVRVMTSLSTLGRDEIEEMVKDAEPIELSCEYCRKSYRIEPAQLQGLITSS